MTKQVSSFDDVIDSRDIISRIESLVSDREGLTDDIIMNEQAYADDTSPERLAALDTAKQALIAWDSSNEADELSDLQGLANQGEDSADDWQYGTTLVRDSYFKNYARELAYECDMVPEDAVWPMTCIDWDQAARELRIDYSAIEFDGTTYWVR